VKKCVFVLSMVLLSMFFVSAASSQNNQGYKWTGAYLGLNGGYGFDGDNGYTLNPATTAWYSPMNRGIVPDVSLKQNGFMGGLQAGANYQFSKLLLIGIESDFQFSDIKDKNARMARDSISPLEVTTRVSQDLKWFGTTRLRFGVIPAERFLVYGTGGIAYGKVKRSASISSPLSNELYAGSSSKTQAGWTLGGGLEFALTKNISLKGEYLYYDLGRKDVEILTITGAPNVPANASFTTRGNLVRAGINYRF